MSAKFKILILFCAIFLASCMPTSIIPTTTPKINLKSGDMTMELTQPAYRVFSTDFSSDGRYVLAGDVGEVFRLWDIEMGTMIRKFTGHPVSYRGGGIVAAFSPDGKYALSAGKGLKLWDLSTGKEIRTFGDKQVDAIAFSHDGKHALSGEMNPMYPLSRRPGHVALWDVEKGKEIWSIPVTAWSVAVSPDGRYALTGGFGIKMLLLDISTGKVIKEFNINDALSVNFSSDGRYALSGGLDGVIKVWDLLTGAQIKAFKGHTGGNGIFSVAFSPDGKYALSGGGSDGLVKLWDISSGTEVRVFQGHSPDFIVAVTSVKFLPNGRYILTGGDSSVRLWDISTGREIAMMVTFENGEWIAITSDGYYNSSEKGAQYLSVKVGETSYSVDSFYDVFYRPDIVAAKLRGEDIKDLITITMKDAIKSPPPGVEINPITASPASPKAKVCYNVKSTGGGIGEVRLFHNGKLIESDGYYKDMAKTTSDKTQLIAMNSKAIYEDMRSVKIKEKGIETGTTTTKSKGEVFNDCKEIDAISGENEISITAFNKDNTVQGYMQTAKFNSTVKQEDSHLYILSIGIDQYKDDTINLKYAVKDSKDIEEKILKQASTLYKPENIHYELLTDNNATKTNITNKITELSKKIKPTDSFILFVAGHGVLLQNQYYMLTSEYDGKVNEDSLISSNEIVEISKKIKSLSQLFIFDTCHAGGVDTIVSGLYDARMSVLAKKMGLHIYASANSKQAAMDGYQGNGLFTYTLLDGLNDKKEADKNKDSKISLVELGEYSKQTTTDLSKKIGHQQTPLIINFGKDNTVYNLR
ncbi:MAG: caspase family protein [Nitrospirae bacterium]|nr:caspase family protein [Nitrospirota bacterium]